MSFDTLLVGKEIRQVDFSDKEHIIITTDKEKIVLIAVGDCCSCSYFEEVDIPLGVVTSIESLDNEYREEGEKHHGDVTRWHFYSIKTNQGHGKISFRNESNGYYDGEIVVKGVTAL